MPKEKNYINYRVDHDNFDAEEFIKRDPHQKVASGYDPTEYNSKTLTKVGYRRLQDHIHPDQEVGLLNIEGNKKRITKYLSKKNR